MRAVPSCFCRPRAQVVALALAMFCRMLGVFLLLPVIAAVVVAMPGGTPLMAGLALGGYGLTQAALQIPLGMAADRFGRKPVLALALLFFAAGGFVAAAANSAFGVVVGRLMQGAGAVAAATAAWIADITEEKNRARGMAVFGVAIAVAFVVSLFVATPLLAVVGASGLFAVAGGLGLASALLVTLLPAPPAPAVATAAPPFAALLANRRLRVCAGGAFVLHYALSALFFALPLELAPILQLESHWRVYAAGFALSLPFAAPLLWFADRAAAVVSAVCVFAVLAGFVVLLAGGAASEPAAVLALALFFAGFVPLEALLPATASRAAPPAARGAAMGLVMSAEFLGVFAGGAASGFIKQAFGGTMPLFAVCCLLVLWLCAIGFSSRPAKAA